MLLEDTKIRNRSFIHACKTSIHPGDGPFTRLRGTALWIPALWGHIYNHNISFMKRMVSLHN